MKPTVTLIYIRPTPEVAIGRAAARCYDSNTSDEACVRRAKHCVSVEHLATLRFAWAHFTVEGISRVCSHQLVRIAHAGILQESQRYVEQTNIEFVSPPVIAHASSRVAAMWQQVQADAVAAYNAALAAGVKKEDARYILPQSCTTSLELSGNFQMFRDLLKNRTHSKAQWEVRDVALQMQALLHQHAPNIFKGTP